MIKREEENEQKEIGKSNKAKRQKMKNAGKK
jgi:hypothetical protein